jgi:hypothetical protein
MIFTNTAGDLKNSAVNESRFNLRAVAVGELAAWDATIDKGCDLVGGKTFVFQPTSYFGKEALYQVGEYGAAVWILEAIKHIGDVINLPGFAGIWTDIAELNLKVTNTDDEVCRPARTLIGYRLIKALGHGISPAILAVQTAVYRINPAII